MSKLTTALATFALAGGALAGTAAPAAADVPCTITNFSPRTVLVGTGPVTRTFAVSTSGCAVVEDWTVEEADFLFYAYKAGPQETFNPYDNGDAGDHNVIVTVYNGDYAESERTFTGGFSLKRISTWAAGTFNASPEPVTRGRPITLRGKLLIADWPSNRYVNYTSRSIQIQFRASTTDAWTTAKNTTTRSDGWVSTTVTAGRSGYWRLVWAGNSLAAGSISGTDYVQVR